MTTTWVLVMYIYAGALAKGDSVTMQIIDGYSSEKTCMEAGPLAKPLVSGSLKDYKFVCLPKR
jgi:hypothetical protein